MCRQHAWLKGGNCNVLVTLTFHSSSEGQAGLQLNALKTVQRGTDAAPPLQAPLAVQITSDC
jgi:hypothetical protein